MSSYDVTIAVMCHPSRLSVASLVAERFANHAQVMLVTDPQPTGQPSAMRTATLAWQKLAESNSRHVGVVQDDLDVSDFLGHTLTNRPDDQSILFLFTSWAGKSAQLNRLAILSRHSWSPTSGRNVYPVAYLFPKVIAASYAEHLSSSGVGTTRDGMELRRFLSNCEIASYVAAPCVVQHDVSGIPSIVRTGSPKPLRRAATYRKEPRTGDVSSASAMSTPLKFPYLDERSGNLLLASPNSDERRFLVDAYASGGLAYDELLKEFRRFCSSVRLPRLLSDHVMFNSWLCVVAMSEFTAGDLSRDRALIALETLLPSIVYRTLGPEAIDGLLPWAERFVDVLLDPPHWAAAWRDQLPT